MSDAQQQPKDGRDSGGRFVKGNPGGGRTKYPHWFRDGGEDSLRTLLAAATGRTTEDAPPAAHELAKACSDRVRLDAAKVVVERIYGKAPDELEIRGDPVAMIRRVIVDVGGKTPELPDDEQDKD